MSDFYFKAIRKPERSDHAFSTFIRIDMRLRSVPDHVWSVGQVSFISTKNQRRFRGLMEEMGIAGDSYRFGNDRVYFRDKADASLVYLRFC